MVNSVRLQNVRLHQDSSFEFDEGVNVIVGPNACGKTTILEAIALILRGNPPNSKVSEMLTTGAEWLRVDADLKNHHRTFKYQPDRVQSKTYSVDGRNSQRLKQNDVEPFVWFDPEELRLLRGSPAHRREYLDRVLKFLDPEYSRNLNAYRRALQQRNNLLKQAQVSDDQFFVWDVRLSEYATPIVSARKEFVDILTQQLESTYEQLAGTRKHIKPSYQSNISNNNYAQALLTQLKRSHNHDRLTKHTNYGPHRDDLVFYGEQGEDLATTASRGEIRSIVLALKLIELQSLEEKFGKKPLLLFDDVFSELDGSRRKAFTTHLSQSQAIVTTTDADIVTKDFTRKARLIAL